MHLAHIVKRVVGEIVSSFSEKHNRHKVTELHPLTTDCPLESGHFRAEVHSLKTSTHNLVFDKEGTAHEYSLRHIKPLMPKQ